MAEQGTKIYEWRHPDGSITNNPYSTDANGRQWETGQLVNAAADPSVVHSFVGGGPGGNIFNADGSPAMVAGSAAISAAPGGNGGGTGVSNLPVTGTNKPLQIGGSGTGTGTGGGIVNTAAGLTPWNIDSSQTVAGQLQNFTNANSPINQQIRSQVLQQANARGLVNSSIAESAAMDAVLKNAAGLASADAATYAKASGYNADQANQQLTLDKNLANSMGQAQLQSDTTRYTANLQAETQKLNNQSAQTIAKMNNDQQVQVAKLNNEYNVLLNSNRDAATAFNNSMQYINAINNNGDMDSDTKTRAIAQIYYNLQTQLRTISATSGINVSGTLSLANAPGFDAQGNYIGFGSGVTAGAGSGSNSGTVNQPWRTGSELTGSDGA